MLDIKIRLKGGNKKYLEVNGKTDINSYVHERWAIIYDDEVINEVFKVTFLEIREYFDDISWDEDINQFDRLKYTIILKDTYKGYKTTPVIQLSIAVDWERWNKKFSIADFAKELKEYIKSLNDIDIGYYQEDEELVCNGFGLYAYVSSQELVIGEQIEYYHKKLNKIVNIVNERLILKSNDNAYISMFKFPPEFKVACEQYLIYFTQFLRDIGIEATSELTNESNKVLFSVMPEDKTEGLEKIKDALLIYLKLPGSPEIEMCQSSEIAVQQLQVNILHFKSQLMLAQSTIQLKDATIEALQLTNYQYKTSLDNMKNKEVSEEPLFKGIIKVGSLKKFGVSIDFGRLLRIIKRK